MEKIKGIKHYDDVFEDQTIGADSMKTYWH